MAYSGGRDSTALLHATLRAAAPLGIGVVALHVHHGLSPHADAWLAQCMARCRRSQRAGRAIEFAFDRLASSPAKGESLEAWARTARYASLRAMARAHGLGLVLLAHHRRDQAETFLLQALRGAGVAGLAGMPRVVEREGVTWARPWLAQSKEAIDAYVRRHRLAHIEDESNIERRLARNRLRLEVWPALAGAFEQAEGSLAAAATWAQEAAAGLDELAAIDLATVASHASLDISSWSRLSSARRSNVLRSWLRRQTGAPPAASLLKRLQDELTPTCSARWPFGEGELRAYRGVLSVARAASTRARAHSVMRNRSEEASPDQAAAAVARETIVRVTRAGHYRLPGWGGVLQIATVSSGGVPPASLREITLLPRVGAERFQAGPGRPPRSLKKQFQAQHLPAWQRDGPLVYSAGSLLYVPGLGIDARALAAPGEAQVALEWIPDSAAA